LILTPVFFLYVGRVVGWFSRKQVEAPAPTDLPSPAEGL
jgi:hypothetical protein